MIEDLIQDSQETEIIQAEEQGPDLSFIPLEPADRSWTHLSSVPNCCLKPSDDPVILGSLI